MFTTFILALEGPPGHELTVAQILIMKQTVNRVRESVHRLAADHRDLHSTVSKVGKAIDRVRLTLICNLHQVYCCNSSLF